MIGFLLTELRKIHQNLTPAHSPMLLGNLPIESIHHLTIITPSDSIRLDRQADSNWNINNIYPCEADKIRILLQALEKTAIMELFPSDSINPEEFGLTPPRYQIVINRDPAIRIGHLHPIQTGIYIERNDSIMVVEPRFMNLVPISHQEFITHRHLRYSIPEINQIMLLKAGSECRLVRGRDSIWRREAGRRVEPAPIMRLFEELNDPEYGMDSRPDSNHPIADIRLIINARDTLFINEDELWSSYNPYRTALSPDWHDKIEWD
ncbi:MAG: DUF4340 domain-containing protein, partial [Candidatus Delongbacteria bacterium]|nr:DUF4340 domain-containing protein [Candidatus Delongbacteria bacterium]